MWPSVDSNTCQVLDSAESAIEKCHYISAEAWIEHRANMAAITVHQQL